MIFTLCALFLLLLAPAQPPAVTQPPVATPPPAPTQPGPANPEAPTSAIPVAFPHPLITEVYYAVAPGLAGDANGDGTRENNGDEFVELVNPHDKPIQLNGYTLSAKAPPPDTKTFTQLKWTFPPLELKPGEIVVVFNGHKQTWTGPVGDTTRAPEAGNDRFHGARVFTMKVENSRVGFVNKTDYVLLTAPDGTKVECVKWGDVKPPANCKLVEEVPAVSGQSVKRRGPGFPFEPHPEMDGKRFSPGRYPLYSGAPGPAMIVPRPPAAPEPGKK
jgi:hypothetical protein